MKKRLVISTIGTSLLTNQITPDERKQGYYDKLRDSSNLKYELLPDEVKDITDKLKIRGIEKLDHEDIKENRRLSAELNGIYGIYNNNLNNTRDMHILIATDTGQGQATAQIIKNFLFKKNFSVDIFTPDGLNTENTHNFSKGIKNLIKWCDETIKPYYNSGFKIIFNLVGGFKSIQGYMNTIGMFYADEIIYIFEASTADLITIPKLPVKIDETVIEKYVLEFALMYQGYFYKRNSLQVPETLLDIDEKNDVTISDWGMLVWNNVKDNLLKQKLLDFPYLKYENSFMKNNINAKF